MTTSDDRYLDGTYARQHPTYHTEHSAWKAERVVELLSDIGRRPRDAIEVGCGAGEVLRELATKAPFISCLTGYEISPDGIERCLQHNHPRVSYTLGDITATTARADLVLCLDVFEHVDDFYGFLRSLREHGRLHIFHIPLDLSVQRLLRPRSLDAMRLRMGHIHYFTRETALAALADSGYTVIEERLTPSSIAMASTLKAKLARLPRRAAAGLSTPIAARVLGGWSLLVAAEPSRPTVYPRAS